MPLTLVTRNVAEACRLAKQLERKGEYRLAAEQLRHRWEGVGERPDIRGLAQHDATELLLRAGSLTGWLGGLEQINGAQSLARDLLNEAERLAESPSQIAQCKNAQAVSYWREGDYQSAKIIAQAAFKSREPATEEAAALIVTLAMIDARQGRLADARAFLKEHFKEVLDSGAIHERCNFHNQFGRVYQLLAEEATDEKERTEFVDAALVQYDGALALLDDVSNASYIARVKNNMALTFMLKGEFGAARDYVQAAIEYAKSVRDNSLLGSFEETRAQILLAEENLNGALVAIRSSLAYLRDGDQLALQAESETTHGVILARMGDKECAESAFDHAISLAETAQISTVKIRLTKLRELMEAHKGTALEYERQMVQLALEAADGYPTQAAAMIGVSHQNFINKIQRFGLEGARQPAQQRSKKGKATKKGA